MAQDTSTGRSLIVRATPWLVSRHGVGTVLVATLLVAGGAARVCADAPLQSAALSPALGAQGDLQCVAQGTGFAAYNPGTKHFSCKTFGG